MNLVLNQEEATFLDKQLERHVEELQDELAHTESFNLQHGLALDIRALEAIRARLRTALEEQLSGYSGPTL